MINIYKQELTNLQQEIIRLLIIKAGTSLNQRAIAKHLGVSAPAVMKAFPELEKKGFIKTAQDKESKLWEIELNSKNQKIMQLKRADNLRQIHESGLADFLEKEYAGATIILFGSYSRGEDIINSDIDVAIIGRKDKRIYLANYEKLLERNINIRFYDS